MKICMALAQGFEEIEAVAVIDILRRANLEVKTFSITGEKTVSGAHGIAVVADELFENVTFDSMDMILLPGGMPGTTHLKEHQGLGKVITQFASKEKWIGAICAAPTVFGGLNLLQGRRATCYPGCETALSGATLMTEEVVVDGKIITSRGPGTAFAFGLKIVELSAGKEKAEQLKKGMLFGC